MGYGHYSLDAHRALTKKRSSKAVNDVFLRNDCDPRMNPRGATRESRDSEAHPASNSIVFALDVSGSMEDIPHQLATASLPSFMEHAMAVIDSPQILVMAFGNAYTDKSALQVGQFESEAALIDQWLASTHIESGGGGLGESYGLAMYWAAHHTRMDCFEKRGRKGYFFMTGDEVTFTHVSRGHIGGLIGDAVEQDLPIRSAVVDLQRSFHTFFLIPDQARADREFCGRVWDTLLHERAIVLRDTADAAVVCALCIGIEERTLADRSAVEAHLRERGSSKAEIARLVGTVLPFLKARAKGPIRGPGTPGTRTDEPDFGG